LQERVADARRDFEKRRKRYGRRIREGLGDLKRVIGNARHHGTPEERRAALLVGYETGEHARCNQFVPQT
jgi:hypothetical protein